MPISNNPNVGGGGGGNPQDWSQYPATQDVNVNNNNINNVYTLHAETLTTASLSWNGTAVGLHLNLSELNVLSNTTFNGIRVRGVGTPSDPTDAANKQYVDSASQSANWSQHAATQNVDMATFSIEDFGAIKSTENSTNNFSFEISSPVEGSSDETLRINKYVSGALDSYGFLYDSTNFKPPYSSVQNNGSSTTTRDSLNFIAGNGLTLDIADDGASDRTNVTFSVGPTINNNELMLTSSTAGPVAIDVMNTGTGNANLLATSSDGGGNPQVIFGVIGTSYLSSVGIDNSDSGKFKISYSGTLGTDNILTYNPVSDTVSFGSVDFSVLPTAIGTPTADAQLATKKYVDDSTSSTNWATHAATQNVNMGNFLINNVATPTQSTDAANKAYVDSHIGSRQWYPSYFSPDTSSIPGGIDFAFVLNGPTQGVPFDHSPNLSQSTARNIYIGWDTTGAGNGGSLTLDVSAWNEDGIQMRIFVKHARGIGQPEHLIHSSRNFINLGNAGTSSSLEITGRTGQLLDLYWMHGQIYFQSSIVASSSVSETLSDNKLLDTNAPLQHFYNPDGVTRNVTLHAAESAQPYYFKNIGTSGNLNIYDNQAALLIGLNPGASASFAYDGTDWEILSTHNHQIIETFTGVTSINVTHNLNKYADFRLIDDSGNGLEGISYSYPAGNELNQINFDWTAAGPQSGKVIVY